MINLPYHISESIEELLEASNKLREKILLHPISPKQELKLRWETNLEKTYWGLNLAGNTLSKKQMARIISSPPLKSMNNSQKEVVGYKNAIDFIRNNWTASKETLTPKDVLNIYDISCKNVFGPTNSYFKSKENEVIQILKYVESGKDHPIIKAGLLQIEIIKLSPFENATGRTAKLLSQLILAKEGFDLRGFLCIEDYYRSDLVSLKTATNSVEVHKSATVWLEYFCFGVKKSLEKTLQNLQRVTSSTSPSNSYWKLSDRMQKIINLLDNPNAKITNKNVQKSFGVSQITASRDLTKLASMGILLAHGKGRSVFYTKV